MFPAIFLYKMYTFVGTCLLGHSCHLYEALFSLFYQFLIYLIGVSNLVLLRKLTSRQPLFNDVILQFGPMIFLTGWHHCPLFIALVSIIVFNYTYTENEFMDRYLEWHSDIGRCRRPKTMTQILTHHH